MVILPKPGGRPSRRHPLLHWPDLTFRSMEILGRASVAPRLRLLVHKPTFACNARCVGCDSRRRLHKASRRNELLSFEQSIDLYHQAARMGLSELHLSGGEPTLYGRLPELVAEARRLDFFVSLNTNGSRLAEGDLAERLFEAGLDGVMLSLYSHREEVHDGLRQTPGLWRKAVAGLRRVAALRRERKPDFLIITQSILSRENLFDAPGLLDLVGQIGSDVHLFSYVEGDYEARLVPTVEMIQRFRRETLPELRRAALSLP
ncbi:MAG: radical SAM protein, partial [Polyangia bacterium]|nr:radical SAM protein [Polyangia bacterium]